MLVDTHNSGMRFHELALQRWFNRNFYVAQGYPIPVIYASPMDAWGYFANLWSRDQNPFNYLLDAKDKDGTPLYEPHPSPPRYPLISIERKNTAYRSSQNYSMFKWRRFDWVTTADKPTKKDLGTIRTLEMPMAVNFRFQVDFFSNRPDTMAAFNHRLMRMMRKCGGNPQAWIPVAYPVWGLQANRITLENGSIDYTSPPEPADGKPVEFRSSCVITVEGFLPDIDPVEYPTLWNVVLNVREAISPDDLLVLYTQTYKLRGLNSNPIMEQRDNVPAY